MMKLNQLLLAGGMAVMLVLGANQVAAQAGPGGGGPGGGQGGGRGRGNWDPAEFAKRMMERTRESLEIKDDTEWKAIEPLVQKVMDARTATWGMRGGFGGRGPRPGGDTNNQDRRSSNPETESLQKAIDSKASSAEVKAALAKYTEARKGKQADLEKAQAELRKVLTPRQEAIATMSGLL